MNSRQAKEKIKELVNKYQNVVNSGQLKFYSEEETKLGFILPLFEMLGWNTKDKNKVSAEEHMKSRGRVDFGFYLNGIVKFYLEAKPFKADLDKEEYAKQAIRYSWHKGVTWAVLTDFESIKVFNAMAGSKLLQDKLVFEISCKEYLDDFDRLWLLSRESFENNSLDKYAEKYGKKIKKLTVNEKLYNDLKIAREILTKSLGDWNKEVDQETLEEGVQRILDRLVFIRVLEDKGLEPQTLIPILREWEADQKRKQLFPMLIDKFRELDEIYNSSIFAKHACEQWEEYDDSIKRVINILYGGGMYEYDFKEIPADILGGVYESYLGYMAQKPIKTDKQEAKAKSRQKRKEQGIYYTPKFIVDYIVANTLGKKLAEVKNISELKKIKILDPACGSGSFLTKALETMNDKYKDFGNRGDQYTKGEILTSNIYGVDLDPQAVEIAKLNLLVEALDQKAKLPDLTSNIRVGNSLISGSEEELEKYFGKDWRDKKPFNWQEEFPFCHSCPLRQSFSEASESGNPGFDIIIGNPPYVRPHKIEEETKVFLWDKSEVFKAKSDLYAVFIEKGISLLKDGGLISFIAPHTWLSLESFKNLRDFIIENCKIRLIAFTPNKVFKEAQVETLIFLFEKCQKRLDRVNNKIKIGKLDINGRFISLGVKEQKEYYEKRIFDTIIGSDDYLITKIENQKPKLKDCVEFFYGLKTADDKKFITTKPLNKIEYKKLIRRRDISRYSIHFNNEFVFYKPELMIKNKPTARPGDPQRFEENKIIVMDIAKKLVCTFDEDNFYVKDALILKEKTKEINLKYITALINSKLLNYYYGHKYKVLSVAKNAFLEIPIVVLPIRKQLVIIKLVDKMLNFNKQLQAIPENSEKWKSVKKEIEKIDKLIDQKVYELYGLNEEEIKVIEN